jgi:hypothetical protein
MHIGGLGYPPIAAKRRRMPLFILAAVLVAQSFFGGLPIDGIHCDRMEGTVEHIHTNLQLYDRGHAVTVPAGIGMPEGAGCLYWMHTHTPDGFIHIESPVRHAFTLGQFFDIWGSPLSWRQAGVITAPKGTRLSIWVDGKPWHGSNPRAIVLTDRETIVIQNGPPFAKPVKPNWGNL